MPVWRPFPYHTTYGHLRFLEVQDYYDMPLLFTCVNDRRQFFVCTWADCFRHGDVWLLVRISPQRLEHLQCDAVELRELFLEPEFGHVFKIVEDHEAECHPLTVERWLPTQIPEDYLAEPGKTWNR